MKEEPKSQEGKERGALIIPPQTPGNVMWRETSPIWEGEKRKIQALQVKRRAKIRPNFQTCVVNQVAPGLSPSLPLNVRTEANSIFSLTGTTEKQI